MSKAIERSKPSGQGKTDEPARASSSFPVLVAAIIAVGGVGGYWALKKPSPPLQSDASPQTDVQQASPQPAPVATAPSERTADVPGAQPEPVATTAPPPRVVQAPVEPAAPPSRLIATLGQINLKQPITADEADRWKSTLRQLVQQGPASVSAIQDFLTQNHDATAISADAAGQLGYPSLRAGLIDSLAQIGGADGTAAMLQILQSSTTPADMPLLAKALDQQGSGQYQQQIVDAARQQLSLAQQGGLGENPQVGPLFQVLATEAANGANVTQDLQQYGAKWGYYSAIALGSLPDGAGIPTLVQLVQNPEGSSAAAGQVLAQLSSQNPQALTSLLSLASSGQLSDHALAQIAPFVAGEQFALTPSGVQPTDGIQSIHMASGNQDFIAYVPGAGAVSPAQVTTQLGIIDQLLQALPPSDDEARAALQLQKTQLTARH